MKTAGIVLAAGFSRRMGKENKLLVELDGAPIVRHVASTALAAGLDPVTVVVGHQAEEVGEALAGLTVSLVANALPAAGLSSSLRTGIRALDADTRAAIVLLGDMPWVDAADVAGLVDAYDPAAGRDICVPVHDGRRGNPVLWSSRFFQELTRLQGDHGARRLLERHAAAVHEVPAGPGVLLDVDTPAALPSH